jgi:hypothetical protein
MIDEDWVKQLASDIISINCLNCKEFVKPLNESCCWCEGVAEIIDFEIYREYNKIEQEFEDQVAQAWEEERDDILGADE